MKKFVKTEKFLKFLIDFTKFFKKTYNASKQGNHVFLQNLDLLPIFQDSFWFLLQIVTAILDLGSLLSSEKKARIQRVKKREINSYWKNSWNQPLCSSFLETLLSRIFLSISTLWIFCLKWEVHRVRFRNFHSVTVFTHIWKIFREIMLQCKQNYLLVSRIFYSFWKTKISWNHDIFRNFPPCFAQCGNLRIFLSLRFYVQSIIENQGVLKLPFFSIFGALNLVNLVNYILKKVQEFIKIKIQSL